MNVVKWPVPIHPGEPCGALFSYAMTLDDAARGFKVLESIREHSDLTILDSGAFSVRRRGKVVDIDRYGAFAAEAARNGLVDVVVNLDVGDTVEMRRNFHSLRRRVGDMAYTMWVHQPFMGWDSLEDSARRFPYVGLGTAGMDSGSHAVRRTDDERDYYRAAHRVLDGYQSSAHGFAMTAVPLLYDKPLHWMTVDSSTWVGSDRFGFGVIPEPRRMRALQIPHPYLAISRRTNRNNTIPTVRFDDIHNVLKPYGMTVRGWSKQSKFECCVTCGVAHMAMQDDLAVVKPIRSDAMRKRLRDGGLAQLSTSNGTCIVLVVINKMSAGRFVGVVETRRASLEKQNA